MTQKPLIKLADIVGSHGVKGRVRIKSHTEIPENFMAYGPLTDKTGERVFKLKVTGSSKGLFNAEIDGITRREQADALRGTGLYVASEKVQQEADEGAYLIADLIGLSVMREDGTAYGIVKDVHNFGAGDIVEIALPDTGKTEMALFSSQNFPSIDFTAQTIAYHPPEVLPAAQETKE